ncbi:ferric reductase-like transmembrane domain-containing protein [Paraeggerthella sp. Marseille-Q4926]|uniref:ferric reductase-like transmembrane domain-containing protein n=1 Tax=Paraeggerthella sp. Marseille-Q4926 TaxID=2866587 RepID=UPI001CE42517|nr:ferric reductase-like transmembrane domain-containing protein [Paraeggerthella sp. Marseille-Q4926]
MTFAIVLACTVAVCFALRNPLKKHPLLFYAAAVAIDVMFIAGSFVDLPRSVWLALFLLVQKCTLSLALFVVVMYIGVFASDSKIGLWLKPVRAELSIVAWILSLGHMAVYLESYLPRVMAGGPFDVNIVCSFLVALVLFALLLILGITSFNIVKKRMHTETWKKVQTLAYPFFLLAYVHLLLMLLPSALRGGVASCVAVAVYSVIFVGYAVLRLARAVKNKRMAARS